MVKTKISRTEAEKLGFRFEIVENPPYQPEARWSFDGGKRYFSMPTHDDKTTQDTVLAWKLNHFYVQRILKPEAEGHEDLCWQCLNRGEVGLMMFHRNESGRETIAQPVYHSGEDEPRIEDVSYSCTYAIFKCDRCGHEDSDYA